MNEFEQYIQFRALAYKYETLKGDKYSRAINDAIDQSPLDGLVVDGIRLPPLKNVCAKVSVELAERLEGTIGKLGMSKREFVEMAIIEALNFSDHVLECVGADEAEQEASK